MNISIFYPLYIIVKADSKKTFFFKVCFFYAWDTSRRMRKTTKQRHFFTIIQSERSVSFHVIIQPPMEVLLLAQWFLSDSTISLLEEQSSYSAMKMKSLSLLLLENDFTCWPNHIVLDVMVSWNRLFSHLQTRSRWAKQCKYKTIIQNVKEQKWSLQRCFCGTMVRCHWGQSC